MTLVDAMTMPPVRLVAGAAAVALMCTVGACGSPNAVNGGDSGNSIRIWSLQDGQCESVVEASIAEFNKTSKTKLVLTTYPSQTYKEKLSTALASEKPPDIFLNWGGGTLSELIRARKVVRLNSAPSAGSSESRSFIPTVLAIAQADDGGSYGLPMNGMQPAFLFYNNDVFTAAGATPPKTYDDLLALVDKFNAKGIVPLALAGSQGWAELMYLEYILVRLAGPEKYNAIVTGKTGAWRDPAVLQALRMTQDLARRGAFGANFTSISYDNHAASNLLASGKAAMHLMGGWEYGSQLDVNSTFATSGSMGWVPFPTITGGAGSREVVGSPSNFFSVRADSKHTDAAVEFLTKTLASNTYITGLIKQGQVPAINGIESKVANLQGVNATFATFTYQTVEAAPAFLQSWDQALPPSVVPEVTSSTEKLFKLAISPEDFVNAMSSTYSW